MEAKPPQFPPSRKALHSSEVNDAQTEEVFILSTKDAQFYKKKWKKVQHKGWETYLWVLWSFKACRNPCGEERTIGMRRDFMNCLFGFGTWMLSKLYVSHFSVYVDPRCCNPVMHPWLLDWLSETAFHDSPDHLENSSKDKKQFVIIQPFQFCDSWGLLASAQKAR